MLKIQMKHETYGRNMKTINQKMELVRSKVFCWDLLHINQYTDIEKSIL